MADITHVMNANTINPINGLTDFPISVNNRQCLTNCYTKGTNYVHPILFDIIRDHDNNTCATNVFLDKSNNAKSFDTCAQQNVSNAQDYLYTIIPQINLDSKEFLANIYELYSFDHVIDWTNQNNYLPYNTIKRVHNLAWQAFIMSTNDLNNTLLSYYYDLIRYMWIKDYYRKLTKIYHITYGNGEVIIVPRNDQVPIDGDSQKIYDGILTKYFPFSYFVAVIKRYIKDNKSNWLKIDSHYDRIKKFCYKYLLKQIQKSIV
jgi:hypothetical protein